jgi:hypothetical protein
MNCKYCSREETAARQRHTAADYRALAKNRDLVWIGPEVTSAQTPTVWECSFGHRWSARYNDVRRGQNCKHCAVEKRAAALRRQPAEYRALGVARGFVWLGPVVANTKEKTHWRCRAGHFLRSSFNQIQQAKWGCCECAGLSPKRDADFHELAHQRGFKWVGSTVVNTQTETTWECRKRHRWEAPYYSILGGSGCPVCYGNARRTMIHFRQLAEDRGFSWLGPTVENSKKKTEWQCPHGHRWLASYNQIHRGDG